MGVIKKLTTKINKDEAIRQLFSNRQTTIETLMEVEDKSRQLVPFKLNPIQADIINNSTWRDIYVKPGQIGFTTVVAGDFLLDNITVNGTVSVIISYDEFSAKRLLMKAKKFHQNVQRRIPSIPKLDHKSATELSFIDDKKGFYSTFYIFSAQSYMLGRGETIHNLLLDEYAFWPVGTHESVFASAVQRVPLKPGTKIRVGSTPNGEDNPFHEMYNTAKEGYHLGIGLGRSVYKPHFYTWMLHPEYQMDCHDLFWLEMGGEEVEMLSNLTEEESKLILLMVNSIGLDLDLAVRKIRWRRYKIAEMKSLARSGETQYIFQQEYPEDDISCFITAGNQAYDTTIINNKARDCFPAPYHHTVINEKTGLGAGVDIWEQPIDGLPYIVSIDPGKGKQSESVAQVWHFEESFRDSDGNEVAPVMRHVATLAGWYDEWEMAEYVKVLGHYFNNAVLCPEDNLDIVSHLRDYPALYYREDVRTGKLIRAIGWQTNTSTKPYMITELNRYMEDIECHDLRFWSQCRNIRRDPTVKYGISVVGADDHHDAGAIAIVCRLAQSVSVGYVGSTGDSGGWGDNWG